MSTGPPTRHPAPLRVPAPTLRHLRALTDGHGIVEHASGARPRPDLGYCTDDAGRLLTLTVEVPTDRDAADLALAALGFLEAAHIRGGWFRLRRSAGGRWTFHPPSDDACGRALLGLGTAAARAPWPEVRERARALHHRAGRLRPRHPRALAYAVLGAAETAAAGLDHPGAPSLLRAATRLLDGAPATGPWRWPWPRLTYANALVPHAQLVAAAALTDPAATGQALDTLDWLVGLETAPGHLSPTPVGGRGPDDTGPGFDQQPIEAATLADACTAAHRITGDGRWADAARTAGEWFLGRNDLAVPVNDPSTGGGFDGLTPTGPNRNQGAESTIAFVSTMARLGTLDEQGGSDDLCRRSP